MNFHGSSRHRCLHLSRSPCLSTRRWITELGNERPLDLSRMFGNAGRPCFHLSSFKVSRHCVRFGDGYAFSGCQRQLKREEWVGMMGRSEDRDWKNTSQVSGVMDLWGAGIGYLEIGLGDGSFENLKHLHAPVLITCEHEMLKNRRAGWLTLVIHSSVASTVFKGLWFGAVRSLAPHHIKAHSWVNAHARCSHEKISKIDYSTLKIILKNETHLWLESYCIHPPPWHTHLSAKSVSVWKIWTTPKWWWIESKLPWTL